MSSVSLARPSTLVYGSQTLDDRSNAFVVGWLQEPEGLRPYILRVDWL